MSELDDAVEQMLEEIEACTDYVPFEDLKDGVEYKLLSPVVPVNLRDFPDVTEEVVTIERKEGGSITLNSAVISCGYSLGNGHYGTRWILLEK